MRAFSPGILAPSRVCALLSALLATCVAASAETELAQPLGVRMIVCFPPGVPVFGARISDDPRAAPPGHFVWRPPAVLADYVSESFYPALSTRILDRTLNSKMETRLEAYRATRGALLNELADQLVALHGVDEETRAAELRAFAEQQGPKIAALEREADELRRDLISGGILRASVDWSRSRKWTVGVTRFSGPQLEREAEFQIVRAAAFYQDGLGPEQRGLLLELADELRVRARAARPIPAPRLDDPAAMFFSPAMSRLRLPKNATPALVSLLGRFNREKTELKRELCDAVFAHDKSSREERTAAFEALGQRQWPRLVELEKIAEEIRREHATVPPVPLRAPPTIPDSLMRRIDDYNRDRAKFIAEFEQTMRVANSLASKPNVDFSSKDSVRAQLAQQAEERAAIRAKVAQAFHEATRERYAEMRKRYEGIRADLELVAVGQRDPETGKAYTGETLLRGYSVAMERFDTFGREEVIYRGYRLAMLMPGLSPEQRRLLFGAALVGLAQPLPVGEPMPTTAQPVPRS